MSRSQIQYGSQGNDVKELQTLLNKNGSKLIVDGIFGAETQKAVKAYQQKYGLDVDGIVGVNTWGKLLGGSSGSTTTTPTTPAAPKVEPLPTNPTYDSTTWGETEQGKAALDAYNTAKDAVANHGDFKYGNQQQLDALINSILNRDKFSYDLN
jgi:peptidoglycan hydrolase-like protein with peptidoglycan-binding domain